MESCANRLYRLRPRLGLGMILGAWETPTLTLVLSPARLPNIPRPMSPRLECLSQGTPGLPHRRHLSR